MAPRKAQSTSTTTPHASVPAAPSAGGHTTQATHAPRRPRKLVRRDRPGHIAEAYARELHEKSGAPDNDSALPHAFLASAQSFDDLAEQLGESVISAATSGEDPGEDVADQFVTEEVGGPFVTTTAAEEFGYDVDASNPVGSYREPQPKT